MRSILWIWLLSTIVGVGAHLLLRPVIGRDYAFGVGFFIYAAVAWPGFRILAVRNGHALSPVFYFVACGIASLVMMVA
ncbi:MAG: hypothetical protein ACRD2J_17630 [Thermoanaerobaculia bacterium]